MSDQFDLIALSFGFFNLLRLVSYLPQIVAVARDKHGATAISLSCWLIWVGANATTAMYSWVRLNDAALGLINGFNAACCVLVLLLAVYKRAVHVGAQLPRSCREASEARMHMV